MVRGNSGRMRWANRLFANARENDPAQSQVVRNPLAGIEQNWNLLPLQAKGFLLQNRDSLNLHKLVAFWSKPLMVQHTHVGRAGSTAAMSWSIAVQYFAIGMLQEARALILNGSFFHQCVYTPIDTIARLINGRSTLMDRFENYVPHYCHGFGAVQSPQAMKAFLQNGPTGERNVPSFVKLSTTKNKMERVGDISDNWTSSSRGDHQKPSPESVDKQIQLVLVDDSNGGERSSFDVGTATTLKAFFNDYADKRGVSLRSLRFSYRGKVLFLSSAGSKTPDDLNMIDQDVINVVDTSAPAQERSSDVNRASTSKKTKSKSRPKKNKKSKKKVRVPQAEPTRSLEEYKAQHSKKLSALHEELQPRLKELRNRLNALGLERQAPKKKQKNKRKEKVKGSTGGMILPNAGTGGKAGKPCFTIQVGEVENLYKTKKSSHLQRSVNVDVLDLHGYTKENALNALNEKLPEWVDTAMKGEYPWVMPVQIVCGCGNQVLSEAVQDWIKSTSHVRNSSRNCVQ